MNTPHGYRLATSLRECARPDALVFDTDLRYWRKPTAWELQSPTAIIAVPNNQYVAPAVRGCYALATALAVAFGVGLILYVALHL